MNSKWLKSSGTTKRESGEAVATKKFFPKLTTRYAFGFARHLIKHCSECPFRALRWLPIFEIGASLGKSEPTTSFHMGESPTEGWENFHFWHFFKQNSPISLVLKIDTAPFRVAKINSQYPNMRLEVHMATQRWGSRPKLVFSMGESPTTSFPMGESPTDR